MSTLPWTSRLITYLLFAPLAEPKPIAAAAVIAMETDQRLPALSEADKKRAALMRAKRKERDKELQKIKEER